eukprot:gnl/TRDRNA2_/TRDRNA2_120002_c0_seq1.p1 gnl/TRDRNA2_/TRDRNA2_120002_c0~~gnl/TRDRNA2_/TRDRNA2_120002_c0_seq1.p1  ORF type:complete len:106 (-),score=29.85 gnl/TRDRNA2_/TRDRNA2_120002_c0_seq1:194-511(-)
MALRAVLVACFAVLAFSAEQRLRATASSWQESFSGDMEVAKERALSNWLNSPQVLDTNGREVASPEDVAVEDDEEGDDETFLESDDSDVTDDDRFEDSDGEFGDD